MFTDVQTAISAQMGCKTPSHIGNKFRNWFWCNILPVYVSVVSLFSLSCLTTRQTACFASSHCPKACTVQAFALNTSNGRGCSKQLHLHVCQLGLYKKHSTMSLAASKSERWLMLQRLWHAKTQLQHCNDLLQMQMYRSHITSYALDIAHRPRGMAAGRLGQVEHVLSDA